MPDGDDWLFTPAMHGLCKYHEVTDGTYHLEDLAEMNDRLRVKFDNERIAHERAKSGTE